MVLAGAGAGQAGAVALRVGFGLAGARAAAGCMAVWCEAKVTAAAAPPPMTAAPANTAPAIISMRARLASMADMVVTPHQGAQSPHSRSPVRPCRLPVHCTFRAWQDESEGANRSGPERASGPA